MIFFGHLGIGNTLAKPFRRGLPMKWVLFGTIFSDLLDKSLYYGLVLLTGKYGSDLGLISGTRTFGHSAVFLVALSLMALLFKSRRVAAVSLGVATHLLLDGLTDYYATVMTGAPHESALLWGVSVFQFPVVSFRSIWDHILSWKNAFLIFSELAGALLLGWEFWLRKNREEILRFFSERRFHMKRRRSRRRDG